MTTPRWLPALAFTLAFSAHASAQTIAPADYLPLDADPQWLLQRVTGDGPEQVRIAVTNETPVSGGVRYELELPFDDATTHARFEFSDGGRLILRSLDVNLDDLLPNLPFNPSATGIVQLTPPAVIGEPSLEPGNATYTTPVDTSFDTTVKTTLGDVDVTVDVTGTITATWITQSSVDTPAGQFDDVVGLSLRVELDFFEGAFDGDGAIDETLDFVLAKDVGFVEVRTDGSTHRLLRAIVAGKPIGEFTQYEDISGLHFTVPTLIGVDGQASSEAEGGGVALHDIRLTHAIDGQATLTGTLDHPLGTGLAVQLVGTGKMRADGTLHLKLAGKTTASGQTIKLAVNDGIATETTSIALVMKAGTNIGSIPIGIAPVVATDVDVVLDGFVDESTGSGNRRKLASGGVLRLGVLEYPITASEKLALKTNGQHVHNYVIRQTGSLPVISKAKATSTDASDFTVRTVKPKLFKLAIPKSSVTDVEADVVAPGGS